MPRELYVEGGGDENPSLASECRRAFSRLFEKAGVTRRPRVVVCGGRRSAYEQFRDAHGEGEAEVWLLVDAEDPVAPGPPFHPWEHVRVRPGDGWDRPNGATDDQLHLMNVIMETWLLADRSALQKVFGPKLNERKLPPEGAALEAMPKLGVEEALRAATRPTTAGAYRKGSHSFKLLAEVSPLKIRALPWAQRFLDEMNKP